MCSQALLRASQPSVCGLVTCFKEAHQQFCNLHDTVATITEQNMRIDILESGDLANPEELIMYKAVLNTRPIFPRHL
jgi:hypothetical protein